MTGDAEAQAEAVLNILAPYVDGPLGIAPVRWPLLAFHDQGRAILPTDPQLRHLARQIVTAIRTASDGAS